MKQAKTIAKKLGSRLGYMVMVFCGALTFFVFAASFETVFNQDLPVVDAVSTVDLRPVERIVRGYQSVNQSDFGNYGMPQYLKMPTQGAKLVVAPMIDVGGRFLARANSGHIALTSGVKNGNLGDALIYYRVSWRTNEKPELAAIGDNLFVDTDRDWRYFYRVTAAKVVPLDELYIARDDPVSQLYLIAVDERQGVAYISQASLVNVQNVRL